MVEFNERKFTIIIPKYDNFGNPVSLKKLDEIAREISERFGGVTITPSVVGCWFDIDSGEYGCENNIVMFATRDCEGYHTRKMMEKTGKNCQQIISEDSVFMRELAKRIGNELRQNVMLNFGQRANVIEQYIGKGKEELPIKLRRRWKADLENWFRKMI